MTRTLLAALLAAVLALAACGDDDEDPAQTGTPETTEETDGNDTSETTSTDDTSDTTTTVDTTGGAAAPVTTASTDLGEILVDADGFSLYGFTDDADGTPTCTDACAETWPPLFVDSEELPDGLDPSVFSVVEHPSGSFQLKAGDWPLYRYTPDTEPGDTTGQGVGGVWYVVDPQGELIME